MKGKIFNAQEVQAILNGSKVMFREVVKNNLLKSCYKIGSYDSFTGKSESEMMPCNHSWAGKRIDMICSDCWKELLVKCPYQVGQKIFCKESFGSYYEDDGLVRGDIFLYRADEDSKDLDDVHWKPAQHMKQEHSRATLLIKEIKVERLAEISEEDARKEGATSRPKCFGYEKEWDGWSTDWSKVGQASRWASNGKTLSESDICMGSATFAFANNWNATHKKPKKKFEANPWVWVYQFELIK